MLLLNATAFIWFLQLKFDAIDDERDYGNPTHRHYHLVPAHAVASKRTLTLPHFAATFFPLFEANVEH